MSRLDRLLDNPTMPLAAVGAAGLLGVGLANRAFLESLSRLRDAMRGGASRVAEKWANVAETASSVLTPAPSVPGLLQPSPVIAPPSPTPDLPQPSPAIAPPSPVPDQLQLPTVEVPNPQFPSRLKQAAQNALFWLSQNPNALPDQRERRLQTVAQWQAFARAHGRELLDLSIVQRPRNPRASQSPPVPVSEVRQPTSEPSPPGGTRSLKDRARELWERGEYRFIPGTRIPFPTSAEASAVLGAGGIDLIKNSLREAVVSAVAVSIGIQAAGFGAVQRALGTKYETIAARAQTFEEAKDLLIEAVRNPGRPTATNPASDGDRVLAIGPGGILIPVDPLRGGPTIG